MGQKVSPTGFRLGITEDWRSRWYAGKDYADVLENDIKVRKYLDKYLARAAVSKIEIERAGEKLRVVITTARPGVVIGKKGAEIDALRKKLEKIADGATVNIEVVEVKRPELDAELGPPGRRRDEPPRVVPRRPRAAADAACQDRLRIRHRQHPDGRHRRPGVGLPRRRPSRSEVEQPRSRRLHASAPPRPWRPRGSRR